MPVTKIENQLIILGILQISLETQNCVWKSRNKHVLYTKKYFFLTVLIVDYIFSVLDTKWFIGRNFF